MYWFCKEKLGIDDTGFINPYTPKSAQLKTEQNI